MSDLKLSSVRRIESAMNAACRHWNFGRPKPGQAVVSYHDVRTSRGGKVRTGSWHVEDGRLVLSSAWGSAAEPVSGGLTLDTLTRRAEGLLGRVLDERGV